MNPGTVWRYLFGNAAAIHAIAQSSAAVPFGVGLVLLTAIARNYDQNFIAEHPLWLVGPLLFSFFSGAWLYFILHRRCVRRFLATDPAPGSFPWRSFMGLFWMTAPIAWLYAIPVEQFLDPVSAAKANLTLLAVVSLWRVLLMARVVSVVNEVPFGRSLGWVLVAAALEVIVVIFFGGMFGGSFGKRVLASMSGMRNAPDETVLLNALGFAWFGAWTVLLITLLALALFRYRGTATPFPPLKSERVPWLTLLVLAGVWIGIAWPAQLEQKRFRHHARLIQESRYRDALDYLAAHEPDAFPSSRRLEPNPYEYRVWEDLPATIALLTPDTPPWIRGVYLNHLAGTLQHHFSRYESQMKVANMYAAIATLPEGREWLRTNEAALIRQQLASRWADSDAQARAGWTNFLSSLRSLGVSESNLATLTLE